jgi:acyl-CoA thioester hydrolase
LPAATLGRVSGPARAQPPQGEFRCRHPIEIRFVDTDALGHVNNAVYFSYFEAARAGYHALVTGSPFGSGPDAQRTTFVIAEARIAYRSQARFGEPLTCACRVSWAGRSSFGLEYRVDAGASPLGEVERGRIIRIPPELRARMEAYEGRVLPPRGAVDSVTPGVGS